MFSTQVIDVDDVVVVRCNGRLVRSEAAYRLRNLVQANSGASTIILDFSELEAVESGGLGMLACLNRWAMERGIHLKILNPLPRVERRLKQLEQNGNFNFALEHESNILHLVGLPAREHWVASSAQAA